MQIFFEIAVRLIIKQNNMTVDPAVLMIYENKIWHPGFIEIIKLTSRAICPCKLFIP